MTQPLLVLIARQPMQRTVQLADRLDITLDEVDRQLRPHLVSGNVIEHEVIAPNGRPAMAYQLSVQFQTSEAGRAVMDTVSRPAFPTVPTFVPSAVPASAATAAPPAAPTRAPTAAPTAAPTPAPAATSAARTASDVPAPAGTKVDRAVACISEHGTVATGQLRLVMNLRPGAHPASYLASALRSGRIMRDGDYWTLGPQSAETSSAAPAAAPTAKEDGLASGAMLGQRPADPAPAQDALPAAARYRCALWSDDILEVQRDGVTVATLEKTAGESLSAFLTRLTRPRAAA